MTKEQARKVGARDLPIPAAGLREETFAYLRSGGRPVATLPVMIAFWSNGQRNIVDGRHRITLAREAGDKAIKGTLLGYGPRGGLRWRFSGWFPI